MAAVAVMAKTAVIAVIEVVVAELLVVAGDVAEAAADPTEEALALTIADELGIAEEEAEAIAEETAEETAEAEAVALAAAEAAGATLTAALATGCCVPYTKRISIKFHQVVKHEIVLTQGALRQTQ